MTVPDLTLDVSGYCPRDREQAAFVPMLGVWECRSCGAQWDGNGQNGRQAGPGRPAAPPSDTTSPTLLSDT